MYIHDCTATFVDTYITHDKPKEVQRYAVVASKLSVKNMVCASVVHILESL